MEKIEYYTIRPALKQMYGKKVNKDTEFEEKTENGEVKQIFKDLTLTTIIKKHSENGGFVVDEESTLKVQVPEDTILIWSEEEGFIIPQYQMCTLEEVEEDLKSIKEIYSKED